jgi:hypothetical protein
MNPELEEAMRRRIPPAILSAAAGLVLLWHVGGSGAQPILATGSDAEVTEDGLHRVDPSIMEAAWVKPDLDLSGYTRILLMPTAVQFREVDEGRYDSFAATKGAVTEFPVEDEKKEWLRGVWRQAVDAEFAQEQSYELFYGVGSDVLVVQGFLVDVVSHIPPDAAGSAYTLVKDPWIASVVLELRDAMTAELLARTVDRRYGEGLMDAGTVWMLTEDLLERWAQVLSDRLEQLSDLGGRDTTTPTWAR